MKASDRKDILNGKLRVCTYVNVPVARDLRDPMRTHKCLKINMADAQWMLTALANRKENV